jgi:hypothetical protein
MSEHKTILSFALPLIVGGGTVTNVLNLVDDKILWRESPNVLTYLLVGKVHEGGHKVGMRRLDHF